MTYWMSDYVPKHIDIDSLAATVYTMFYEHAPHKSGEMRDGIDYEVTGRQVYWWDDCVYAHYQDTGCDGKGAVYEGWWSESLPQIFNHWLSVFDKLPMEDK